MNRKDEKKVRKMIMKSTDLYAINVLLAKLDDLADALAAGNVSPAVAAESVAEISDSVWGKLDDVDTQYFSQVFGKREPEKVLLRSGRAGIALVKEASAAAQHTALKESRFLEQDDFLRIAFEAVDAANPAKVLGLSPESREGQRLRRLLHGVLLAVLYQQAEWRPATTALLASNN